MYEEEFFSLIQSVFVCIITLNYAKSGAGRTSRKHAREESEKMIVEVDKNTKKVLIQAYSPSLSYIYMHMFIFISPAKYIL